MARGGAADPGRGRADRLAAWYDLDLREPPGDLDLYLALANRVRAPILELAAGSGRLAVPLAAAGHAVTAVDADPAMLARAEARWRAVRATRGVVAHGSLDLVEGDLLDVRLETRFGLVILALNSLFLLGTAERQASAIAAMARHLRPRGVAVVDVWLPVADELDAYDGRLTLEWMRDEPDGRLAAKLVSARHDPATATVELTTFFDAWPAAGGAVERTERVDRLRLVSAGELVVMVQSAGLEVEQLAGDYDMAPFGPGAERVIVVCRLV